MNKLLWVPIIFAAIISIFIISQLFLAANYGIMGAPGINLLNPVCNSTVSGQINFSFEPKPSPYNHYLIQVRSGESWDSDNYLSITTYGLNYVLAEPLSPGIYQYNVIGFDSNNETRAGSSPCRFIVE